ncbi:MAG: DUF721 domain-containing protein [bacterium]
MKNIAELLKQKQNLSPMWKSVSASLIVDQANQILIYLFGDEVQKHVQAVYYKNNTLTMACLGSIMAQEIKFNEAIIIEQINAKFGQNTVKKLRYLA